MNKKLFVGGLPFQMTSDDLKNLFGEIGTVDEATVIINRQTGRSKGFGFVEMSSEEEAQKAVEKLNGSEVDGRKITVNEARPPRERF